ncbi:hypothetical protein [Paenibacillus sp. GCM10027626]|uniref:hypothetical protein n=1 Tax=Paenibacillus sp. GCM10027626 TaxID=3273411 RepID=UPI00363FFD2C
MLSYRFDDTIIDIQQKKDGDDFEFLVRIKNEAKALEPMRAVRHIFEDDDDYTDVLFYAYPHHEYKVIVRQQHYVDFIVELLRHRLLEQVAWDAAK